MEVENLKYFYENKNYTVGYMGHIPHDKQIPISVKGSITQSLDPKKFIKNKKYAFGYKGHIPGKSSILKNTKTINDKQALIPGYKGYVFALETENLYGKSFHRLTKEIKEGEYYRKRPHFSQKMNSIAQESYKNPSLTDGSHTRLLNQSKYKIQHIPKSWETDKNNLSSIAMQGRMRELLKKN